MKKIKKMLLAFAPLAAIAVATPIVLTACSDTTTNTTPGEGNGSTNPGGGNNSGGNGNGSEQNKPTKPSFAKDKTNDDKYMLDASSEAQKILEDYKKAKGKAAADKVLSDALNGFPKKENKTLPSDVLNMWSNNNWFTLTKKANDNKVKETFVSNLTITKAEVVEEGGKTKATFDVKYESGFVDSNGKVYEATQLLKADKVEVDNTTKIEISKELPKDGYKIDGKVQELPTTSLAAGETTPQANLETFLKQSKVSLDAKTIFDAYIANHNIKHADEEPVINASAPIWDKSKVDKDTSLSYTSTTAIVMQLSSKGDSNWGNCVDTTTYADIVKTMKNKMYNDKIKSFITTNDYDISTLEYGAETDNGNNTKKMTITVKFTKKASSQGNDTKPTLTFEIKGFGKPKQLK